MQSSLLMIKRLALFFAVLILLSIASALALLGTSGGRSISAGIISDIASSNGQTIDILGLNSVLGDSIEIEQITLADAGGVWATANNLKIAYRLSDLVFGNIRIEHAQLGLLKIDRQPQTSAGSAPPKPLTWPTELLPSPLRSLDLTKVNIEMIDLGSNLVGKPARLSLSGQASATNEPLGSSGQLSIQHLDNTNGTILADWKINPTMQTADVSLKMNEDRDGLLANMLNIPNRPAVAISIDGSGPLANWSSKLAVAFDNEPVVSGSAVVSLTEEGQTINATLAGKLAPLLPKTMLPLVAGNTDIKVVASRDAVGNIQIDTASLNSALAQVRSSGIYSPTQNRVDMSAELQIGNEGEVVSFERQPGVKTQLGLITLASRIDGTVSDAMLSVRGELASFSEGKTNLSGAIFEANSEQIDLTNLRGSGNITAQITNFATGSEPIDLLLDGGVSATAELELANQIIDFARLNFKTNAVSSNTIGRHDLTTGETKLASKTSISSQPNTVFRQVFGNSPGMIETELTLSRDGKIDARELKIKSANLNATGTGVVDAAELEFSGEVNLANLGHLHSDLAGSIQLVAAAKGPIGNPNLKLELQGDSLIIADKPLEGLGGTISGSVLDAINMNLVATYEKTPISASARLSTANDGPRKIDNVRIVVPGGEIAGEISISDSGLMAGYADLGFEDLSRLAPLLLQSDLSGSATGRVELFIENGKQNVSAILDAPKFNYDQASLSNTSMRAMVGDIFGAITPKVDVQVGSALVAGETLKDTSIAISNNASSWPITAKSNFAGKPLSVAAVIDPTDGKLAIGIQRLSLIYRAIPVSLSEPIFVNIEGERIQIDAQNINLADGKVMIAGAITDQINLNAKISDLSMSAIESVAETGFGPKGTLNASAKLSGSRMAPAVAFQFEGQNLSGTPFRDAGLASLNVAGSGGYRQNALSTNFSVTGGGLSIAISGSADLQAQSVNFAVKGVAPFAYAARPLTQSGVVLNGSANIDARATGTFTKPSFQGQVSTSGAQFTEIASRIRVTDLSGTLSFDGDTANLSQLSGRLGKNGNISANGSISLRPEDKLSTDLSLKVRNGEYDDGSVISTTFDADLSLKGRLAETGNVSGTINVNRTDVTIPETLPNVISPVAVTHKNADAAIIEQSRALSPANNSGNGPSMSLDILVNAPNRIFVRGRGLDAELGGSLKIEGTTAAPIAKGAISMSRGRMDILTKRFDFDSGRMSFAGPLDPSLNFVASTRDGGSTYSIFVRGLASAPVFSFGSSPSLPQDQIVAKLFFGRSLSDLSPLQLVQLANAIGTLNGSNSGPGLLDRLRAASGLDDVDIKTNEQGETSVGVGAYLNDRTYINVEKGTSAGSGKVTIDLNITDNITARGETSEDGKTKAGVFYETDY